MRLKECGSWRCQHCGEPQGPMWGDPEVLKRAIENGTVTMQCVSCAATLEAEAITKAASGD